MLAGILRLSKGHAEIQCTEVNKPGHINNPLHSAVWAELNNCSGIHMESIIINFYSIIDFHS